MVAGITQCRVVKKKSKVKNAVYSGILGWILDAYDFFVLVFLIDVLAQHFHLKKFAMS